MTAITPERYLGLDTTSLTAHTIGEGSGAYELYATEGAWEALHDLQADAVKHGFWVQPCSAFRSFARQGAIVEGKFTGARPILDRNEQPLQTLPSDPIARLRAILLFSALPGCSRHHFGSDFDIYDPHLLPAGQKLKLTAKEYAQGSYFYELGLYLQESLSRFGFARPYMSAPATTGTNTATAANNNNNTTTPQSAAGAEQEQWGIGREPWHISHLASARDCLRAYDAERALTEIERSKWSFAPFVRQVWSADLVQALLRPDCA